MSFDKSDGQKLIICGLYYKSFTIIIFDGIDSSQYNKSTITIIALCKIVNYDQKLWL